MLVQDLVQPKTSLNFDKNGTPSEWICHFNLVFKLGFSYFCQSIQLSLLSNPSTSRRLVLTRGPLFLKSEIVKKWSEDFFNYSYFQMTTVKGQRCWRFVLNSSFLNPPLYLLKPLSIYGNFGPKWRHFKKRPNKSQQPR